MDAWAYRDATQANDEPPRHPTLPVGLVDLDHLTGRAPWEQRIGISRQDVARRLRMARTAKPQEPWVDAIIRRTGRIPFSAADHAQREVRRHLEAVRAGCGGVGVRLAETRAGLRLEWRAAA